MSRKEFQIRVADTEGRRATATMLITKMYSWRGYHRPKVEATCETGFHNSFTLILTSDDRTIGTVSIRFDSTVGLGADLLYKQELDKLRALGYRLCEGIRLAIDPDIKSRQVLAAAYHMGIIYAYHIQEFTTMLVEVHPRHVRFYKEMLGFRQIGAEKINPRVKAPAVLLQLDLGYAQEQISKFGGRGGLADGERSLYPYFFLPSEEAGIAHRLAELT